MNHKTVGTTLAEVLVALVVMSLVMMGIYCIQIFSDNQVVVSNRKAALQNEVSYILEHMTKYCSQAVGGGQAYPVDFGPAGTTMRVWIDSNHDGILTQSVTPPDTLVYYCFQNPGIIFCPEADPTGYPGVVSCRSGFETLGTHITTNLNSSFITLDSTKNYIIANLSACWDPGESSGPCGSLQNPRVNMTTSIPLYSVNTN